MNINLILDLFKFIQNLFKFINRCPKQNYLVPKKLNGDEWKT